MDYKRIYAEFIADRRAKESSLSGYTEKHHITPRSLGGDDSPDNLIRLSAEDHVHAHVLLAKAHDNRQWIAVAYIVEHLQNGRKVPTRRMIRLAAIGRKKGNELRSTITAQQWADPNSKIRAAVQTDEYRAKLSASNKAWHADPARNARHRASMASPEVREKLRQNTLKLAQDPEWRRKAGAANVGRKMPDEMKAALIEANKRPDAIANKRRAVLERAAAGKMFNVPYHKVNREVWLKWKALGLQLEAA